MIQHHKYSKTEIEGMIPWERDVYVNMLIRHLEEEKERMQVLEKQQRSQHGNPFRSS